MAGQVGSFRIYWTVKSRPSVTQMEWTIPGTGTRQKPAPSWVPQRRSPSSTSAWTTTSTRAWRGQCPSARATWPNSQAFTGIKASPLGWLQPTRLPTRWWPCRLSNGAWGWASRWTPAGPWGSVPSCRSPLLKSSPRSLARMSQYHPVPLSNPMPMMLRYSCGGQRTGSRSWWYLPNIGNNKPGVPAPKGRKRETNQRTRKAKQSLRY